MSIPAIFLCIVVSTIPTGALAVERENVCSSMECQTAGSVLLKKVDRKADPCNNFYEFTCGGFLKSPPVNISLTYDDIMRQKMTVDVLQVITANVEANEPRPFKLVKIFYKSCMNMTAIEAKGLQPLKKYLRDSGGWPVIEGDTWNGETFDWRKPISKFRCENDNCASDHLIQFKIDTNSFVHVISTVQTPYSIIWEDETNSQDYLDDEGSFVNVYYESLVSIARLLGAEIERAEHEMREIVMFDLALAKIKSASRKILAGKSNNFVKISQLNKQYPTVPWRMYVQNFVESSMNVTDETLINVRDPNYYVRLEDLMASTPKRVQANFVMSRIALRSAVLSTEEIRTLACKILGQLETACGYRLDYCEGLVMEHLWRGVTAMYATKFLNKRIRFKGGVISRSIKSQLKQKLLAYNWSRAGDKELALEKVDRLFTHIGYPKSLLNLKELDALYRNLQFSEDDYFGNMNNLANYDHGLIQKELDNPYSTGEWRNFRTASKSSASSYLAENIIVIPDYLLREPYFDKNRPSYMNYGALGYIIGHEMTHAFFENSFYRGSDGNNNCFEGLRRRPEFGHRTRCLIDHYENYVIDNTGITVDGRRTLAENIADIGGIRLAYEAYQNQKRTMPEEPKLPGFENYTTNQMFWISSGSCMCEKIAPNDIPFRVNNNNHAIHKYRVIGMMSNMPEFARDFNCPINTVMNPAERCDIWHD